MPKGLMPCQAYDMEPTITANLEYFIADHLSYPACLFSFLGYLIHLLLSVVQFIDFQTIICCSIVYIYCRSKQPLLKEHGSSFSVGAAKRLFSRDVSVYLLNFIDHFSHDDASKQIPIPIFNPEQVSFPNVAIYFQRLSNLAVPFLCLHRIILINFQLLIWISLQLSF